MSSLTSLPAALSRWAATSGCWNLATSQSLMFLVTSVVTILGPGPLDHPDGVLAVVLSSR